MHGFHTLDECGILKLFKKGDKKNKHVMLVNLKNRNEAVWNQNE